MAEVLVSGSIAHAIGWALIEFAWQGAVATAITAIVLLALRNARAQARYIVACAGLLAMAALPAVSTVQHLRHSDTNAGPATIHGITSRATSPASTMRIEPAAAVAQASAYSDKGPPQPIDVEAWLPFILGLWVIGVSALSVRLMIAWIAVDRIRRVGLNPAPECLRDYVVALASRVGLARPVRVLQSRLVDTPVLLGWLRPVILLPTSALTGLSPVQLEAVIAHEIAHAQRHDVLVNILQTLAETLLFYHPGIWWISRRVRIEREHCCDDAAVEACGDRLVYVRALAILEELRAVPPAFGLAATDGSLLARIRRVLGMPVNENRAPMWVLAGVLLSVVAMPVVARAVGVISPREADPAGAETRAAQRVSGRLGGIRGHVIDDRTGRPLGDVSVAISQAGRVTTLATDVSGRYEVRGLTPGEYYVIAEANDYVSSVYGQRTSSENGIGVQVERGQMAADIDVRLHPAASVSGRVFSDSGDGLPGVEIEVLAERYGPGGRRRVPVAWAQTEQAGLFRVGKLAPGEYYVRAYTSERTQPSRRDGTVAYAATHFPHTTNLAEAQPIVLSAGQHLSGVDLTLATVKPFVVTGRLIDTAGEPFTRTRVFLEPANAVAAQRHTVAVSVEGLFRIARVTPGDYMLRAIGSDARWLTATSHIAVVDEDVSGVELVARPGARVEGRIRRDVGRLPFDPRTARVEVVARVDYGKGMIGTLIGAGPTTLQPDGTFAIDDVTGPVTLSVSQLPSGWTVKAIRMGALDITDAVTDFGDGVRRGIEIILTDQRTELVGRVADRDGRTVRNYTVVVFPEDRGRWAWPSRFVRAVRPAHDGAYRVDDLPPANYMAVALQSIPQNAWSNADVLERLWSLATPLRLTDGDQRVVNLRLAAAAGLIDE